MRFFAACGLALACGGLAACGTTITEADRQLIYQNQRAGEYVETSAENAKVKQAGKDIRMNSEALVKTVGVPKSPEPYTPQASSAARDKREQEHKPKWWQFLLPALAGLIGGGGLLGTLSRLAPRVFGGPAGAALSAVITGISAVRERAASNEDKKVHIDDVIGALAKAQEDAGVRELVRAWVKKVETKIRGTP